MCVCVRCVCGSSVMHSVSEPEQKGKKLWNNFFLSFLFRFGKENKSLCSAWALFGRKWLWWRQTFKARSQQTFSCAFFPVFICVFRSFVLKVSYVCARVVSGIEHWIHLTTCWMDRYTRHTPNIIQRSERERVQPIYLGQNSQNQPKHTQRHTRTNFWR